MTGRSGRPTRAVCACAVSPSDTGLYTPPTVLASHLLAAVAGDRGRRWRPRSSADRTAVRRDQAWREELANSPQLPVWLGPGSVSPSPASPTAHMAAASRP